MKKKILLIALVIFVSIGLLSISKVVQNKYLNKNIVSSEQEDKEKTLKAKELKEEDSAKENAQQPIGNAVKEEVKPVASGDTSQTKVEDKTVTDTKTETDSKKEENTTVTKAPTTRTVAPTKEITKDPVVKKPEPTKEANFTVVDDISGKTILALYINAENKTVADITFSALDNSGIAYKATGRGEVVYFTMISDLKARDSGPLSGWCYYVNGVKSSVSCGAYKLKPGDVVAWKYLKDGVNN